MKLFLNRLRIRDAQELLETIFIMALLTEAASIVRWWADVIYATIYVA